MRVGGFEVRVNKSVTEVNTYAYHSVTYKNFTRLMTLKASPLGNRGV